MAESPVGKLTPDRSTWAVALIVAPVGALAFVWLLLVVARPVEHPLFGLSPRNLSEAAAFRDGAAIVRRVSAGENPGAPGEVRGGFISREPVAVTPIEAAARVARAEIVRVLIDLGTPLDAVTWRRAWCSTDDSGVRAELTGVRPPDTPAECPVAEQR